MLQGDKKFNGGDKESKAARAEEIAFNRARAEESAARGRSQKARIMARYKTGTEKDLEEEEEVEHLEVNFKKPATKPIGGSRGWEKEIAARACLEKG